MAQAGQPPSDPFNDPFGDKANTYTVQQTEDAPSRFSPPANDAGPSRFSQPQDSEPMAPSLKTPEAAETPMDVPAKPSSELPPPRMQIRPERAPSGDPNCKSIYEDRNCCEESSECTSIREELGRFNIRRISLDISPSFTPDEDDPAEAEARQAEAMDRAPSRKWYDQDGEFFAEGRLLDIRDRKAVIDTGETVKSIQLNDLGRDEMCFVAAYWNLPFECRWEDQHYEGRNWNPLEVNWTASALCHKPLYFEERALERYGHMSGPITQPLLSGAHFFGSAIVLPYQMGMYPPRECRYALGYYRPGNCAPRLIPPVPLSARGAAAQAGVVVAGAYWIP